MKLLSPSFEEAKPIPSRFTCDVDDVSPELRISDIPENTKSLALLMDDPDATGGITWDHWVMWNIDPKISILK